MIVLGLTGSIGMGKSGVAKMLRKLGVPVHDSDKAVHEAMMPKGAAFDAVTAQFPQAVTKGAIDRKKLGAIVFADREKLSLLESILHPVAQDSQRAFIRSMQAKGKRIVCLEIPLLFETGAEDRVDYTMTVSAPPSIQKRRVMKRENMTPEKFLAILDGQMPDAQKRALSDFVVDTGLGYARTYRQLQDIVRVVKGRRHA